MNPSASVIPTSKRPRLFTTRGKSPEADCPRRWVGSRCGCALRRLRTVSRCLQILSPGQILSTVERGPGTPRMWHWHRLTSVRIVRHTSVDNSGRLSGRVSVICASYGIQALLSHRHRRACPLRSPLCHGRIERIICTGRRRRAVDRHRHERGICERPRCSQRCYGRRHDAG
jgi:hypothetical protein